MRNLIDSRSLFRTCGMCFKSRGVNNIILQQATFSVRVQRITHLSIKNFCTLHCCYDIEPPLHWRLLPNGYCLCFEVYETSSNLSFASFSRQIRNNQFPVYTNSNFLEFGKTGLGRERVEKTLKMPRSRHQNLGSQFAVLEKIAFFEKFRKHTKLNYNNLNNKSYHSVTGDERCSLGKK